MVKLNSRFHVWENNICFILVTFPTGIYCIYYIYICLYEHICILHRHILIYNICIILYSYYMHTYKCISFIFRFIIISSHVQFLAHNRFLEDSWQERWCELSQLPQGLTLHRNGKIGETGLMGFPTYTREKVLSFKWMGSQIGKMEGTFTSCVAKGQSSRCCF